MLRGREFEIFDEPEPDAAQPFGDDSEPPPADGLLSDPQGPAARRELYGDASGAGWWARRVVAVATLAAAAATAALLLPLGGDRGDGSPVAGHAKRAPLAKVDGRVQNAPSARASSSRPAPGPTGRVRERQQLPSQRSVAGAPHPVTPSPPAPPVAPPPPAAPPQPTASAPPPPMRGSTGAPAGKLPAPAAPRSPF